MQEDITGWTYLDKCTAARVTPVKSANHEKRASLLERLVTLKMKGSWTDFWWKNSLHNLHDLMLNGISWKMLLILLRFDRNAKEIWFRFSSAAFQETFKWKNFNQCCKNFCINFVSFLIWKIVSWECDCAIYWQLAFSVKNCWKISSSQIWAKMLRIQLCQCLLSFSDVLCEQRNT